MEHSTYDLRHGCDCDQPRGLDPYRHRRFFFLHGVFRARNSVISGWPVFVAGHVSCCSDSIAFGNAFKLGLVSLLALLVVCLHCHYRSNAFHLRRLAILGGSEDVSHDLLDPPYCCLRHVSHAAELGSFLTKFVKGLQRHNNLVGNPYTIFNKSKQIGATLLNNRQSGFAFG